MGPLTLNYMENTGENTIDEMLSWACEGVTLKFNKIYMLLKVPMSHLASEPECIAVCDKITRFCH